MLPITEIKVLFENVFNSIEFLVSIIVVCTYLFWTSSEGNIISCCSFVTCKYFVTQRRNNPDGRNVCVAVITFIWESYLCKPRFLPRIMRDFVANGEIKNERVNISYE